MKAEDEGLRVNRSLVLPAAELKWRFTASGGPGGQHANTSNTRVELAFDIASSAALSPAQRARLVERLGETVQVVVSDERSQARNRALASARLADRLRKALEVQAPRRPTSPTRGSTERRLQAKRQRSEVKAERRSGFPPSGTD